VKILSQNTNPQGLAEEQIFFLSMLHGGWNLYPMLLKEGVEFFGITESETLSSWIAASQESAAKGGMEVQEEIVGLLEEFLTQGPEGSEARLDGP
jgi:hypothetical protein